MLAATPAANYIQSTHPRLHVALKQEVCSPISPVISRYESWQPRLWCVSTSARMRFMCIQSDGDSHMQKRYSHAAIVAASVFALLTPGIASAEPAGSTSLPAELASYDAEMKAKVPPQVLDSTVTTAIKAPSCVEVMARLRSAKEGPGAICVDNASAKDIANIPPAMGASSIITRPSWCENRNDTQWHFVRDQGCLTGVRNLSIIEYVNGVPTATGGFGFSDSHYFYTYYNQSLWGHQLQIRAFNGWGTWSGTRVTGRAICSGDCTLQDSNFPQQAIIMDLARNGESYHQSTATNRDAIGHASTLFEFWFSKPGYWDSEPIPSVTPRVRCDHALPGNTSPGCIVADGKAVKVHSLGGPYREAVEHIRDAQNSGLPGAYPNGAALHRTTDQQQHDDNRDVACPRGLHRPPGKSCDEYPFASTHEGGLTGNFSRRMIDATQNTNAGISLILTYYSERILHNEPFWVYITP